MIVQALIASIQLSTVAAIFGNSSVIEQNIQNITWSHTVNSGENLLVVGGWSIIGTASSATYNGVAMTLLSTSSVGPYPMYLYYLVNPPVGTYNIVVNHTSSSFKYYAAASYSEAGSVQPNANANSTGSGGAASNTVTSIVEKCLHVGVLGCTSPNTPTAGANTIRRASGQKIGFFEKNVPTTPAGSSTLSVGLSTFGGDWAMVGMQISP